jgi:hypothetical protein
MRRPAPQGSRLRGWTKRASSPRCPCCRSRREALKKTLTAATVLAATAVTAPSAAAADQPIPWWQAPHPQVVRKLRHQIRHRRAHAVRRAWKLGAILHPVHRERYTVSVSRLERMDARWHRHAQRYKQRLIKRAPVYAALACIHSYEGSWDAYSPAGPYYGGYQMDPTFEATYGPEYLRLWGDASSWPPVMQRAAAYRATRVAGYTPWPNSAALCGLL